METYISINLFIKKYEIGKKMHETPSVLPEIENSNGGAPSPPNVDVLPCDVAAVRPHH